MPKSSARKLRISEADVQTAVVQILELDGWRAIRTDPVSDKSRGKGFGEVGMPDYLFIRYEQAPGTRRAGSAEVLWVEFKAPGKSCKTHQLDWHLEERLRGALVMMVDSVDDFRDWYKISWLMRHQILS
jgi:hypothetical protein